MSIFKKCSKSSICRYIVCNIITSFVAEIITFFYLGPKVLKTIGNAQLNSNKGTEFIFIMLILDFLIGWVLLEIIYMVYIKESLINDCISANNALPIKIIISIIDCMILISFITAVITGDGISNVFTLWASSTKSAIFLLIINPYLINEVLIKKAARKQSN